MAQRRFAPAGFPAFQIAQIHGAHGTLRKPKLLGYPSRRSTLAGLSHHLFEAFAEGRLAGQLLHLLDLQPAVGTTHTVQLDHHRGAVLEARQIPHLSLRHLGRFGDSCSTTRANQPPITTFSPHPQLQCLGFFVNLLLVHGVARPAQNLGPVVASQTASLSKHASSEIHACAGSVRFLLRAGLSNLMLQPGKLPTGSLFLTHSRRRAC